MPLEVDSYTYDDYSSSGGLSSGYHNLTQDAVTLSTFSGTYATTYRTYTTQNTAGSGSFYYYDVDKVTQSKLVDSSSHAWQCQGITYDENAPSGTPIPAAGWPTTIQTYSSSNCTSTPTNPLTTTYTGYDQFGNPLVSVDGVATANSSLYSSNGCTASPTIYSSHWGKSRYTACIAYDATYNTLPTTGTNALGQSSTQGYTHEEVPSSVTDANTQVSSESYSYDGSGNSTLQVSQPGETNSYTTRSVTGSSCTETSTLPCYEIDTNSYLYNTVKASTFYDSLGRAVETRTPGPGSGYDTVVITTYNDQMHTTWQSVPFEVTHGTGWIDPNGAKDYNGTAPGGTVTYYDALGRAIAVQDPSYGQGSDGIACSVPLTGTYSSCVNYQLGQVSGDSNYYVTATAVDPNSHVSVTITDGLGRTVYVQYESGKYTSANTTVNEQMSYLYNVLGEPTSATVTDKATQSGQSITSVTTTAQYDDLGRMTQLADPDRGTHTYSYDGDGKALTDVSGSRTLGYSYDLLGRLGCEQNQASTQTVTGTCTSGATQYVVNTYDTTKLGTQGTSDFPIGRLTQSVATTYYPDSSSATVTESYQHDTRGRQVTEQMQLGVPGGWNVTTALPTYKLAQSYNDANQLTTTTTSTIPTGQGFTTTQVYDSTTGAQTGLSNTGTATATLATLLYNARAQLDTLNFLTSTGTALMGEQFGYDATLRATSATATWGSGSGSSGTTFSQGLTYDPASNLISLATTQAAVPGQSGSGGSETQNFCYDEQNRLVWAGNSGTQPSAGNGTCGSGTLSNTLSGASYSNSFVYTHLGQLWQGPLNGGSTQYQYLYCSSSTPHQLTGLYPTGTTCSGKSGAVYTSSYDAFGNVTSRFYSGTTAALSYDALDHFTQWNAGSNNFEQYVYDASGTRVLRRSTNGSGTTMTVYAFGLEDHSYSSSGSNTGNTYYYSLAGRLIGKWDGTNTTFYLVDALGTPQASFSNVANSAALKGNQVYGPYGKQNYHSGSIGTPKGFTGQYNDSLTGLDYYNARYYDPVAGVFLSADTVQGNPQGMNPYAYVGGNPETHSDPTGLRPIGVCYNSCSGDPTIPISLPTQPANSNSGQYTQTQNPVLSGTSLFIVISKAVVMGVNAAIDAVIFNNFPRAITDVFSAISTRLPALDNLEIVKGLTAPYLMERDGGSIYNWLQYKDGTVGGADPVREFLGRVGEVLAEAYAIVDFAQNFTSPHPNSTSMVADAFTLAAIYASRLKDFFKGKPRLSSALESLAAYATIGAFGFSIASMVTSNSGSSSSTSSNDRDNRDNRSGGGGNGGLPPLSMLPALMAPGFLQPQENPDAL